MFDFGVYLLCALIPAAIIDRLWRRMAGGPGSRARHIIRTVASVVLGMLIAGVASWRLSRARSFQTFGEIVTRVETGDSVVALTFDDGPLPGTTEQVLGMLRDEGVHGTFFLVGEAVENHTEQARRIIQAGHEIGNHTYTHPRMVGLSMSRIEQEITRTDTQIRRAGYRGDIHFRSPYGNKYVALPWYLSETNRKNIFWDIEPDSYPEISRDPALIARHVIGEARPGSIILLHVMTPHYAPSLAAVPAIIRGLKERGYRFVTVSELLKRKAENT